VEAKVAARRPETKVYTTTVGLSSASAIANGTLLFADLGGIIEGTGFDERIGNKIRVHKVECDGFTAARLGVFLLKSKLAVDPAVADFTATAPPLLVGEQLGNVYTELYSHASRGFEYADVGVTKFSRKWKTGIPVSYEDPTTGSCSHNNLYVVLVNKHNSANLDGFLNVRVWYTDC